MLRTKPLLKPLLSKKEFVYQTLREQIQGGNLAPSARLVIDDLAAELQVSPIPVREALQQLQADGYVVIEPFVGAKVTDLEVGSIVELFEAMEALEVISSRTACERMTAADLGDLEALLREMDKLVDEPEVWSHANLRLHDFLCDKAEMHLVAGLLGRALDHWNRLRRFYFDAVFLERIVNAQQEHWAIFEALKTSDPKTVEAQVRAHNRAALGAYLIYLNPPCEEMADLD